MKKIIILLTTILATQAQARNIFCSARGVDIFGIDRDYGCYIVVSSFFLDLEKLTYRYNSFYDFATGRFCGWPPAGDYFEGKLVVDEPESIPDAGPILRRQTTYRFADTLPDSELVLEEFSKIYLTFKNPQHQYSMDCSEEKEREGL